MVASRKKRNISELFSHNWGLKLTSLVTAILLFSLVRGAEDAQRSVFVEVTALLPSSNTGKMLISEVPDRVRLTLQGSRSQINDVRDLEVTIDLTDTDLRYYYFADDDFDVPAGVTIAQVAPASVQLTWADRLEKRMRVEPQLVGELPDGLALAAPPRVNPPEVLVVGPETELDSVRTVNTADIDRSTLSVGPNTRTVPLSLPSGHSRFADETPARVSIDVVRDLAERTLTGVMVTLEGSEGALQPAVVSVTVQGAPSIVDLIDQAQVQAVATPGEPSEEGAPVTAPLELRGLPTGADVVSIDPAQVTVTPAD